MTTIKVSSEVRDRLARLARARNTTMGNLLAVETSRLEIDQRWQDIEASYERLRMHDPQGWREYVDEVVSWTDGTTDSDALAADEWPVDHGGTSTG